MAELIWVIASNDWLRYSMQPIKEDGEKFTVWNWEATLLPPEEGYKDEVSNILSVASNATERGVLQIPMTEGEFEKVFYPKWLSAAVVYGWCECPRCGGSVPQRNNMKTRGRYVGALSRVRDVYICSECGTEEALLQFGGENIDPDGPHPWKGKK